MDTSFFIILSFYTVNRDENGILEISMHVEWLRRDVKAKAPLRVQLLLAFGGEGGEEQEALTLLSKKEGGGRGL